VGQEVREAVVTAHPLRQRAVEAAQGVLTPLVVAEALPALLVVAQAAMAGQALQYSVFLLLTIRVL
jgi:hypothetical protein